MLTKRESNFHDLVWAAAARVGRNAPKVVDEIMREAFPMTLSAAEHEGADRLFRIGLVSEAKRILRAVGEEDGQSDFSNINPQFKHLVRDLKSKSYFVEEIGEYCSVAELVADSDLLDDARKFMRRKGNECLEEAKRLDALYAAVTA
jgi:hypothetical protein